MITRGLGNMPPSLESAPVLIYHSSSDATTNADGRQPPVQSVLRAASPLLPPEKQWQVLKLQGKGQKGSGNSAMQHAKLLLLRFGERGHIPVQRVRERLRWNRK